MATKKKTTKKAAAKDTTPKMAVAVICGYCGSSEVFDSLKDAQDFVVEDMRDNGHSADHYQIVAGQKVELKVDMKVTWNIEGQEPIVTESAANF